MNTSQIMLFFGRSIDFDIDNGMLVIMTRNFQ